MTTVGPVCHIPPNTTAETHDPVPLPSIPSAQPNLQSLTATVNALRHAFMVYTGQIGPPGARGAAGRSGKDAPSGSWKQTDIQTEKVKIYQNNDPSTGNFIEVERINKLTFTNGASKQTWVFNRPPDTGA